MRPVFFALFCLLFFAACGGHIPPRVLIFSKTTGFRHESIEAGKTALVKLCYENGIQADTTENAVYFNEKNLKRYAAVVFLNTNGEVLDARQEADFERYIQAGGGFMGVHSASATEYTWRWYGALLGGYFKDHPAVQETDFTPENCTHPATQHLDCKAWKWKEELYNFRNYEPDIEVLLSVNDGAYKGGNTPDKRKTHPLAWCHEYDGGRAFYTALGHIPEAYSDPVFQKHLLGGLQYAIGKNRRLNYARCRTQRLPDQSRFVKTVIASDLAEPMEIALLPDDKILMIERHGRVKLFNPATGLLNTVTKLPVYSEMGDGLMGLCIDPNWSDNRWIYLHYSSLRDSMNQLSRFVFQGDTLDLASEKVLLTIPVGHKDCNHAAGSMTFDPDGNLFLSTGDNTSPFASDGFAPMDERPGRKNFDAQRSSGNTADLRGKIIRIRPQPDGSYICPAGNLFTDKDVRVTDAYKRPSSGTRNEIYAMGCRNPFRISYDERRKLLYWGDIGSDAGKNDPARGPMGHDEINRTAKAGNFGWPYFTGDNQAYREYDFEKQQSGDYFDPAKPVNNSPNNTGLKNLPPAQAAFIWYPYSRNRDFPMLGSGGRNAMAGPVFYADDYPAESRFPDYYDGKLIIYDWMRNWLMAVTTDTAGNFNHLEPFADSVNISRPMDMFFDKKGTLWLIEYGTLWYSSNEDARLSRIDFVSGNRAPLAVLKALKTQAAAPADIEFSTAGSMDYDGGDLHFELDFGDGSSHSFVQKHDPGQREPILRNKPTETVKTPGNIRHRYERSGTYEAILTVRDEAGAISVQKAKLFIGNEVPELYWDLAGRNRSFYRPGDTLHYRLLVQDREDGSLASGGIPATAVSTSVDFFEKGFDPLNLGKTANAAPVSDKFATGKRLVEQSDCKNCHAIDRQINGPAFEAVAARYRNNNDFAVQGMYRKIIYGSSGNWGQSAMIAHPQIREEDAIQMARWILSLGDLPKPVMSVPLSGTYVLKQDKTTDNGAFLFRASYQDRGSAGQPPLGNTAFLLLRPATLQAEHCDKRSNGVSNHKPFEDDRVVLHDLKNNSWFAFRQLDLSHVKSITVGTASGNRASPQTGGKMELRLGSMNGEMIGESTFVSKNGETTSFGEQKITLLRQPDGGASQDLFFVFRNDQNLPFGVIDVDWVRFDF